MSAQEVSTTNDEIGRVEEEKEDLQNEEESQPGPESYDESEKGLENLNSQVDNWTYKYWLRQHHGEKLLQNIKQEHLALTWKNVTVKGVDRRATLKSDVLSVMNPLGWFSGFKKSSNTVTILNNLSGQVLPGEMLLVIGRPGSGCTSFLKTMANKHASFQSVDGDIFYGSMKAAEGHKYRGKIVFNSEEDIHLPTLTVAQTLSVAIKARVSRHVKAKGGTIEHLQNLLHATTKALGLLHAHKTQVGNEYVRGVSGGERKRVSIGEVLATQASIVCWDNATRGLDASTALEYVQNLRAVADETKATILVSLYQTGNGIFDQFEKVLVLEGGRPIYYGPRSEAKAYFENLGFACVPGANIADFLTSVTVPTERQIKPGYEDRAPRTAVELERAYLESSIARQMKEKEISPSTFNEETALMQQAYREAQPRHKSPLQSSYIVGLFEQILICMVRQVQVFYGDKASQIMIQVSALIQALVSGSLYYNLPANSTGIFTRTGALYYPLVFFNLSAMAEVVATFLGRPILNRHRDFSLYRPLAYVIARALIDIPIYILQATIFSIVFYFMTNFQVDAGKFFTFWLLIWTSALVFVATYRMIGCLFQNFDNASRISGLWCMISSVYAGYFIPYQNMHPWFRWIFWLNPQGYAYEALMGNEFGGLSLACIGEQRVPNGANYTSLSNWACTVAGATADGSAIIGEDYIRQAYDFSTTHLWRNYGVLVGWWVFFTCITAIAVEFGSGHDSGGSSLVYKRSKKTVNLHRKQVDEENGPESSSSSINSTAEEGPKLDVTAATFTWEHLCYTVSVPGGQRKLLDNVMGWVRPGQLTALMGSSGAGKTTLLDVLAQRKDVGIIEGEVLVDGRPPPSTFQRSAGYCEQMDVHEKTSTVREALIFSARLRQPRETPDHEKIEFVDSVIRLLELEDLQDALIGVPGAGLTVEQRKRVTIGVELAAKPSILLFLDEPTSGLDGQAAFNVVRFLRKLTQAGQAVLCTIHQPSASLFEAFDSLLLLAKGGKMVYFGETGTNSSTILKYFNDHGAPCPPDANPAEHIIDVVSGASGAGRDWHQIWMDSPDQAQVRQQLHELKAEALLHPPSFNDDNQEFATPLWTQLKLVSQRQNIALFRNPEYIWNKITYHIFSALFSGFTFWMMPDTPTGLQQRLLTVFNFLFVAVGVISQLQPLFLHYRDIFEAREKKAKMYSWLAFVTAQLVVEIPYLIICGTLYFACWYFTAGLPVKGSTSGQVYLEMIFYEFLYTSIGQAIAAISPNEFFASLLNPVVIGAFLINFAGVLVPYSQMVVFWRYWMYYLDPFNYLTGGLLTQLLYDVKVTCGKNDLTTFSPPHGETCGSYMADYLETGMGYIVDNSSTTLCQYCSYASGSQYAKTLNLNERYYGWRDTGISVIFCISSYGLVFLMMKLRSKKTKSAKME